MQPGQLWAKNALVGKVGSVFTSSGTQHGGQESTILTFHVTLLHQGMVIVGLPYAFAGQTRMDEITGGSPYGASTIVGGKGERMPSENELASARWQGRHVAAIACKADEVEGLKLSSIRWQAPGNRQQNCTSLSLPVTWRLHLPP